MLMLDTFINHKNVLKIIEYGSKVYGTNNENSDTDYIIIIEGESIDNDELTFKSTKEDFHIYSTDVWEDMGKIHDIGYVEAHLSDDNHWLKGSKDEFEIDYDLIRTQFARTASNSWVKCKKKFLVEKDYNPYIAKKSLFHSLRILMFGIQIMKQGKIVDFSEANIYYKDIMDSPNDWEYLKEKYQPIYNKLKSEFRLEHSKLK